MCLARSVKSPQWSSLQVRWRLVRWLFVLAAQTYRVLPPSKFRGLNLVNAMLGAASPLFLPQSIVSTEPAPRSRRECELSRAARRRAHCHVEDRARSIDVESRALHVRCMHCTAPSDEWTCGALAAVARSVTSSFKEACLVASTPSSAARSCPATAPLPLRSRIALRMAFGFEGSACRRRNRRRCAQETSSAWDRPPGA